MPFNERIEVPPSLYRSILNEGWGRLPDSVRNVHLDGDQLAAEGTFDVQGGRSHLSRWLARVMGLPNQQQGCRTRLELSRSGGQEIWRRIFRNTEFRTVQWRDGPGRLAERWGPLILTFVLLPTERGLTYRQHGAALRAGRFCLRVHSRLAPRVTAEERDAGDGVHCGIEVTITIPVIGLVACYRGRLKPVEDDRCR